MGISNLVSYYPTKKKWAKPGILGSRMIWDMMGMKGWSHWLLGVPENGHIQYLWSFLVRNINEYDAMMQWIWGWRHWRGNQGDMTANFILRDKEKTELLGGMMYDYITTTNITRIRLQQRNGILRSRQFQRASFKRDARPRNMWRQFLDFSTSQNDGKNHERTVQLCPTVDG